MVAVGVKVYDCERALYASAAAARHRRGWNWKVQILVARRFLAAVNVWLLTDQLAVELEDEKGREILWKRLLDQASVVGVQTVIALWP